MKKVHYTLICLVSISLMVSSCKKGEETDLDNQAGRTVTDKDGNSYKTVTIGTQTWMAENLKTTKYNDGTAIANVTDDAQWLATTTGAYCVYNNDAATYDKYGKLYNWHAVKTGKLAPAGWHVATYNDWMALLDYVNKNYKSDSYSVAQALCASKDWPFNYNPLLPGSALASNNKSGLSALPGGFRYERFDSADSYAFFWTGTQVGNGSVCYTELEAICEKLTYDTDSHMYYGMSVRCVKD
jgi:uncharacterized protein (TIGR02145 family)